MNESPQPTPLRPPASPSHSHRALGHPGGVQPARRGRSRTFPHRVGPPLTEAERAIPLAGAHHRGATWLSAALTILTAVAAACVCLWLGRAVDALAAQRSVAFGWDPLGWLALAGISETVRMLVEQRAASDLVATLQRRLLRHAFALGPARLGGEHTGGLVALMTQGAEKIALYRQTYLGPLAGGLATPLVALAAIALALDPVAAGVLLLLVPAPPLLVRLFAALTRRAGSGARKARGALAARYLDAIQGLETLAVTGAAWRMAADLADAGERNRTSTMRVLKSNQLILFVIDAGFNLVFLTCGVVVAAWRASAGALTGGEAVALVALTILMLEPMAHIGGFFYVGMGGRANQAGSRKFLGRPAPRLATTRASIPTGAPRVTIDALSFAYPGGKDVLANLSLEVAAGEHVAIVGPSGGGKSTLVHLLTGTLTPAAGRIALDGADADAPTLRAASALVSQRTWLFTGTVRDNLTLVAPTATDADLWEALTRARLADEVRALPAGLDTVIGERGAGLSGGQAQRLSLARAFVSGRRLLVLDEPTSSIDLASEAALRRTLAELGPDYTVILVTHRRSAIDGSSCVLSLSEGVVSEEVPA